VNLDLADLRLANLEAVHGTGVSLLEANLMGARMIGTSLRQARLQGAYLAGATMVGTKLDQCDLSWAQMEGLGSIAVSSSTFEWSGQLGAAALLQVAI
jgi:uncharacterized protein YjbI with pentapeptide repeats